MIHEDGTWETRRCLFIIIKVVCMPTEMQFLKWSRQYHDNRQSIYILFVPTTNSIHLRLFCIFVLDMI